MPRPTPFKSGLRAVIPGIVLCLPVIPAWGGFKEGLAAHNKGDYDTALKEFRPITWDGDIVAQYNLGVMYDNGQGGSLSNQMELDSGGC